VQTGGYTHRVRNRFSLSARGAGRSEAEGYIHRSYQLDNDELPLTPEQIKELFAEWNRDYAAAKERDARAVFRGILNGTTDQTPLVRENQKDRKGGIER